jgi:hypothetical protein
MTTTDPTKKAASAAMKNMRGRRGRPQAKAPAYVHEFPPTDPAVMTNEIHEMRIRKAGNEAGVKPVTTTGQLAALQSELDSAKTRRGAQKSIDNLAAIVAKAGRNRRGSR